MTRTGSAQQLIKSPCSSDPIHNTLAAPAADAPQVFHRDQPHLLFYAIEE